MKLSRLKSKIRKIKMPLKILFQLNREIKVTQNIVFETNHKIKMPQKRKKKRKNSSLRIKYSKNAIFCFPGTSDVNLATRFLFSGRGEP